MEDDDSGRPTLLVVLVPNDHKAPHLCSILHIQSNKEANDDAISSAAPELAVQLDANDYVAHFHTPELHPLQIPPLIRWMPCLTNDEELLMVPFWGSDAYQIDAPPLKGLIYNLRTDLFRKIKPPNSLKPYVGCSVNLGGLIYFLTHPYAHRTVPCIERYDPVVDSWQTLASFPMPSSYTHIKATAVWYDNILFNMVGGRRRGIWAFNVTENTWYPVVTVQDEEDELCYRIVGEAVVLENTIYALKDEPYNSVLALSIQREENNSEIVYTCSLVCEIPVLGLTSISSLCGSATRETRYLFHLGQGNFCLVQSCERICSPAVNQPVQVTHMKLEGNKSMIVTDNCVYEFPIEDGLQFRVALCFSLQKYKTFPVANVGQGHYLNPFPAGYDIDTFDVRYLEIQNADFGLESDCPCLTRSKRLKTVGEDFEQCGGTPEIHMKEHVLPEKSSASASASEWFTTVPPVPEMRRVVRSVVTRLKRG